VRLLLDTHTLIWWLGRSSRLGRAATDAISDPTTDVLVSAASAWEIAIKRAVGKLEAPTDLAERIAINSFQPLPISVEHGERAGALPLHHRDPFDRMIIAQAQAERATVVTADPRFAAYDVTVLPAQS